MMKPSVENTNMYNHWKKVQHEALRAVRLGREILLEHFGRLEKIEKKHLAGLVSEADKLSEEAIIGALQRCYPDDEFLGEESAKAEYHQPRSKGGRWILDPLDGTTNYIQRFPIFCISLAYEFDGEVQIGIVDVPLLGETYTAIRGHGSYLNGRRLKISEKNNFSEAFLATGFFPEDKDQLLQEINHFSNIVGRVRGVRRAGAAAYDLALVASGVFDGFWEKNLKPWDVAAGQLLVTEAGGVVTDFKGIKHHPYSKSIVAGNLFINKEILEHISRAPGEFLKS